MVSTYVCVPRTGKNQARVSFGTLARGVCVRALPRAKPSHVCVPELVRGVVYPQLCEWKSQGKFKLVVGVNEPAGEKHALCGENCAITFSVSALGRELSKVPWTVTCGFSLTRLARFFTQDTALLPRLKQRRFT